VSIPFGFGTSTGGGDDQGPGSGMPFFRELERLMSWQGGPVNWDLAGQVAHRELAGAADPPVDAAAGGALGDAVRLADVWLDGVTALPSGVTKAEAWTRRRWLEATLPQWRALCDPVAARVAEAMSQTLQGGLAALSGGEGLGEGLPEGLAEALPPGVDAGALAGLFGGAGGAGGLGPLQALVGQLGGMMFGAQVGQALGGLAGDVLASTEVGLPLGPAGVAALLPAGVTAFGEGLGVPPEEVLLFLAAREAAHHRLFAHVPWLRSHLGGLVEEYARGISIDPAAIAEAVQGLDPTDPASVQKALGGGLFEVESTPVQRAALARLETALALVEGWVDAVVAEAVGGRLPGAVALRETVRRRRASGGPAEQAFATLVGLQLRPRRLREAATLWQALAEARGADGRDAVWASLDLLPTADDLDDPLGFVRGEDSAMDPIAEIEALGDAEAPREDPPRPD